MEECATRDYKPGEVIFTEGEESDYGLIVISGSVELSKRGRMKIDVAEIIREGFFGLLPMMDKKPRNFTAKAREQTTCMIVPTPVFMLALKKSDPIIQAALHSATRSLRQATGRLSSGGVIDESRGDTH